MKVTASVPVPYFYYPGTTTTRRLRAHRPAAPRRLPVVPVEENDELAQKQEAVCGVILGLSLFSTLALCFWQLATT